MKNVPKGLSREDVEAYQKAFLKLQKDKAEQARFATPVSLTRGNKAIIEESIDLLPDDEKMNLYSITSKVAELLINKYGDDEENRSTDYQLERAGMKTSKDIMQKVQYYLQRYSRRIVISD